MQTQLSLQPPCVVDKPFYRGVISSLYRFGNTHGSTQIASLVRANQLVVSQDGATVALLTDDESNGECVEHSQMSLSSARFHKVIEAEGLSTQILLVEAERLVIWGRPTNEIVCGVYEFAGADSSPVLLYPFPHVKRVCRTGNSFLLFGADSIGTPYGVFSTETLLSWVANGKMRYVFLEQCLEALYTYALSERGFENPHRIQCAQQEQAVSVARVQNQFVLLSRTRMGSRLRVVGSKDRLTFLLQEWWLGTIEHLWVSPNGRSLAWLVRPDEQSEFRMIYVNGQLIHSGVFQMNHEDVVWDQFGTQFGAKIASLEFTDFTCHMIVTSVEQKMFAPNVRVREFLLDPDGSIAAYIEDDGEYSTCHIRYRHFDAVSYMWNLHRTNDGGIAFNSVIGQTVRITSDTTDLIRH